MRQRILVGMSVVVAMYLMEWLAALHGGQSKLQQLPTLSAFVDFMAQWVMPIARFGRCAVPSDAGTALMIALSAAFFPLKLGALCYAFPARPLPTASNWRDTLGGTYSKAAWRIFYAVMIAVVCLVPTWIFFGPPFSQPSTENSLAISRVREAAMCKGGTPAFVAWGLYSTFAIASAFVSVTIVKSLSRFFIRRPQP